MEATIQVDHVNKQFKEIKVLKDINVSFEKGKIHGLIGRNGSGKTVLQWNAQQDSDNFERNLKECMSMLNEKFKRISYTAGFKILKDYYHIDYDFVGTAKALKNEKDVQKQIDVLPDIKMQLENRDVKHVLLLKDIAYTRVQNYWSGVSFLHRTKNKEPS
ncbi:MAG: ATP-binding cassette domain-containing protein [Oscillospiraceae bacterium]|nr:ATP-binding cassette domain-containing protein [Oscillospiraceae bacterium]